MTYILGTTNKTVPFSAFNEGKAGEIFAEVRRSGPRIVMNHNTPECVLVPMNEYEMMTADHDDMKLMAVAQERLSHFDRSKLIPAEEIYREFGITQEDIESWEDVELE